MAQAPGCNVSGCGRSLPDTLLPVIRRFAAGKSPDELLFTRPGSGQLHRQMFVRQTNWATTGHGRTLHDLRHTAACDWILHEVPLTTVQAWLGHSSIEITSRYLHHLGDFADRAALQLLNNAEVHPVNAQATQMPDQRNFGRQSPGGPDPDHGLGR